MKIQSLFTGEGIKYTGSPKKQQTRSKQNFDKRVHHFLSQIIYGKL